LGEGGLKRRWFDALWPLVAARLPPQPARVVEIGCGSLGGFVPALTAHGYSAVGVDPAAPDGPAYVQLEFERADRFTDVDAVIASTSLHHVADPALVLDRVVRTLRPDGRLVVIEWAWEEFDEPTAGWCFQRLSATGDPGWLHRRREEWVAAGQPWDAFLADWARREGLHEARLLLRLLDERFHGEHHSRGPYFFPDLADTSPDEEQRAIDEGEIRATRVDYVGRRP
jgi:SAM-dependent methyltransferase